MGKRTRRDTRMTCEELVVRFWAPTKRLVDIDELCCRCGDNKLVRTEDDDRVAVCFEKN